MSQTTVEPNQVYQTTARPLTEKTQRKFRQLLNLFHNSDGVSLGELFTYTQLLIVVIIAKRLFRRVQLILPTQYGKSLSVAIGVLLRISTHVEKWAIIAPTEDKARIIMDYIIEHIFDDAMLIELLDYHGTKEQMLQEKSKSRVTLRGYGEIRIYTADSNNVAKVKKALTGFGAPNIVLDESSLLPDEVYSMVKRMLGGSEGTPGGTFLLEIGNPFFRNHFWRTWIGGKYVKIFLDYIGALAEGRYSEEYMEEMRAEAFFDVLYECHFPEDSEMLPGGYRHLFSVASIENAFIDNDLPVGHKPDGTLLDRPLMGVDPNHGGANFTAITIRYPLTGFAKVVLRKRYDDVLDIGAAIGEDIIRLAREYGVEDEDIAVDEGGVGTGICDYLWRKGLNIKKIMFGQSAKDSRRFANAKAELYFRSSKWILTENGKLVRHEGFLELKDINGKENNSSKLQIESKEDLSKRGIPSPDIADSFALTFVDISEVSIDDDDEEDFV